MNGLPYYKRFPRDFIEGTIGMPFELKAAYSFVLDLIYMQGGKLPDDARYIAGLLGVSVRKWSSLREGLIEHGKIKVSGDFLTNDRAIIELESLAKYSDKQSENRSRPNKNKGVATPAKHHTEPDTEEGTDVPSSKRVQAKPKPERFSEFWDAYPHRGGSKKGRSKCEPKYARLIASGIPEQALIDAAQRYRADRQVIDGYAKNPETWLNGKGWEDEIEPSQHSAGDSHDRFASRNPRQPSRADAEARIIAVAAATPRSPNPSWH